MKKSLLPSLLAAMLLIALAVSPVGAKPDPFIGVWTSTDIDGSSQTLNIGGGGGGTRHVRYYDDGATVCGLDPDTGDFLFAASARGPLSASGNTLSGNLDLYCMTTPPTFNGTYSFTYTYDPVSDTLTDWLGVVWSRR
jgi:hypothetical protein